MSGLLFTILLSAAFGFVISALATNTFRLMHPGSSILQMPVATDAQRAAFVGLLILAGPHILVRAATQSWIDGDWPASYIVGCYGLGTAWAFAVGLAAVGLFLI
jgi:hypothetical protein